MDGAFICPQCGQPIRQPQKYVCDTPHCGYIFSLTEQILMFEHLRRSLGRLDATLANIALHLTGENLDHAA